MHCVLFCFILLTSGPVGSCFFSFGGKGHVVFNYPFRAYLCKPKFPKGGCFRVKWDFCCFPPRDFILSAWQASSWVSVGIFPGLKYRALGPCVLFSSVAGCLVSGPVEGGARKNALATEPGALHPICFLAQALAPAFLGSEFCVWNALEGAAEIAAFGEGVLQIRM